MKWLVYIFSFYIMLLSGVPCNADNECCTDEICDTATPDHETKDKDHKPACPCSPFTTCGACHAITVPDTQIELIHVLYADKKTFCNYTVTLLSDFPPSIWQPPKPA
ncbi:DUF6660 family protein [Chitinophaga sp. SYP-B3965]|uniref:DUF6660 family protein n=1 Tax=Chitinophaga sp. SYP-B3965 TaxID=2663120 RepID=UPI00352F4DF2